MNKKLVLSVLSTAVVASMASAAMAKPGAGFYVGADVDKYYSIGAFFDNFDEALDNILDNMEATVFVDGDAKAAPFLAALEAEDINTVLKPATKADFENNPYAVVGGEEGQVYNPAEDDELPNPGEVPAELKVESVSAINTNYVVVKVNAAEEDRLAQTIEVKNSAGVVVEVKPLDIAAGDTVAEFEFVTAVKADDLKGVWTVAGQSYDLDLFNKLEAFLNAADQIALNKALADLGVANVKVENMPGYFAAKADITKSAEELTLADVQKLVDDVNAKSVDTETEKAIVKAVVDAADAGNQVALLQALQNSVFVRVNPNWVATATDGYLANIAGTETSIKDIQDVINASNDTILKAAGTLTVTGIDRAKLTASKALIDAYATVDKDGNITDATIKAYPALITEQLAVADVVGATTPTAFKAKLTALATLVNDATKLDMKNYVDANGKAYVNALKAKADADKDTLTKVEAILFDPTTGVNAVEAGNLVAAVKNAATVTPPATVDANKLFAALNALGVKQVAESNKDAYAAETDFAAVTDKDDVQDAVNKVNLAAITGATDADKLLVALKVLELKNVVDANKDAYLADVESGSPTIKTDAATIDNALKAINKQVIVDAQVKAVNEAETVSEVKAALDALANVDEVADYLKIRSVDRDFVAAYVLEERPDGGYVAGGGTVLDAIDAEVTAAQSAHATALAGINALTLTDTPDAVVAALDAILDENFSELSNVQKSLKAQEFQDKLTFKEDGTLKTPFVTLAAVKELLFN